jgi:hypothetical protein
MSDLEILIEKAITCYEDILAADEVGEAHQSMPEVKWFHLYISDAARLAGMGLEDMKCKVVHEAQSRW